MAKRKSATLTLCVLGLGSFASNNTHAQGAFDGVDGCSVLGELVTIELMPGRWFGKGGSGLLLSNPGQIDIMICNQTARTVTGAFTSALAGMNINVSWGDYPPDRRDTDCSADLSQCFPRRVALSDAAGSDQAFILDSWRAVRQAVSSSMPLGTASDTSRFSASGLGATLSHSLEHTRSVAVARIAQAGVLPKK